jgi:branched-subunit amino acid aminotransferase/4-amino-4-deoxychorismate lyase
LLAADEVMGLSTTKEVLPIGAIGENTVPLGPVATVLQSEFLALVRAETGADV